MTVSWLQRSALSHRVEHSAGADPAAGEPWPHAGGEPQGPSVVGLRDAKPGGWYREDTGELFRGMTISADEVVVDVGCGAGANSVFCPRCGAQVYAVDRESRVSATCAPC